MRAPHPDLGLATAATTGVLLLILVQAVSTPPAVAIVDTPAHEGARVSLDALVLDVKHGARGRYLMLADETARLPALGPPGDGPLPGERVRAIGIVTRTAEGHTLSLESLTLLEPAAMRALTPAALADSPERHEGARLLLAGTLRDGALVADGARIRLMGEAPPEPDGEWLVTGALHYRARELGYVFVVDAWSRPS